MTPAASNASYDPSPAAAPTLTTPRQDLILAAIGLALLVVVAYWPSLSGGYVRLDDYQYVVDNELVRHPSWSGVARFFSEISQPSTVEGYYQPLTMVSFMLDVLLVGDEHPNPFIFHLTNVLLHAAATVLVMFLVRRIVGGLAIPLLTAVFFALHPAQVESVAWISQRKTVLATVFALGCIHCYLLSVEAAAATDARIAGARIPPALDGAKRGQGSRTNRRPPRNRLLWLAISLGLYAVAGLAKPTVMLLPLTFVLLDFWPLRRPILRSLPEKAPFVMVLLVMAYVAWISQASSSTLQRPTLAAHGALLRWIGLLCHNLALYAGNIVWPFHLSPYRAIPADISLANPVILGSFALSLVLFVLWLASIRWSPPFFVGLAAFTLVLSPAMGAVRFMGSCVADRFTYLPLVFLLLPLSVLVQRLERLLRKPELACFAVGLFALPLAILMRAQQGIWQNSKALYTHIAEAVPDLPKAQGNLALICLEEERPEAAIEHCRRALQFEPENGEFLHLLGRAYVRTGRAAEAIPILEKAIRGGLGRAEPTGYLSLAEAFLVADRPDDAANACAKSVALGRTPAATYAAMGDAAMRVAHLYDVAAEYYRRAIAAEPDSAMYRWNLGTALHASGLPAEALKDYEEALAIAARNGERMPTLEKAAADLRRQLESAAATQPP